MTLGALAAAGSSPAPCEIIAPRELPSGAEPGDVTTRIEDGRTVFIWGAGPDQVVLAFGYRMPPEQIPPPPEAFPAENRTEVRGVPASVLPVGDLPESAVVISWLVGNCHYSLGLAGGTTLAEAAEYARRY